MYAEEDKELMMQVHKVLEVSLVRALLLDDGAKHGATLEATLNTIATVATAVTWLVKKNYLRFPAEAKPSLN